MKTAQQGDPVRVRRAGESEWAHGSIAVMSANGLALAIALDESCAVRTDCGGIVMGVLPLLAAQNPAADIRVSGSGGIYRPAAEAHWEGLEGTEYEVEVTER